MLFSYNFGTDLCSTSAFTFLKTDHEFRTTVIPVQNSTCFLFKLENSCHYLDDTHSRTLSENATPIANRWNQPIAKKVSVSEKCSTDLTLTHWFSEFVVVVNSQREQCRNWKEKKEKKIETRMIGSILKNIIKNKTKNKSQTRMTTSVLKQNPHT